MTQTEMRSLIDERKATFEQLLSQKYEQVEVNGEKCFRMPSNVVITVTPLYSFESLVIEYADSLEAAANQTYEDGDLFGIKEYEEAEMFQAMFLEINQ